MSKTANLFLDCIYERLNNLEETLNDTDTDCHFDDVKKSKEKIIHHFKESNIALLNKILYSAEHNRGFKEELIKNLYDCLNLCRHHSYMSEVFNQEVHMNYHHDDLVTVHYDYEKILEKWAMPYFFRLFFI